MLIVNPVSGRGFALSVLPFIEKRLHELNLSYDLLYTERPWHAAELAEQAARKGYDVVVSVAGDGTANEILNGLMKARRAGFDRTAMSILPVGTGNDLAYAMNIHASLEDALETLAANKRRLVDVGVVHGGESTEGRYFGNGVGIGFDAVVGFEANKIRWTRGTLAYLLAALRTIFIYYSAPKVAIRYDEKSIELNSLMVSIMNGQRMGGGFFIAPKGNPDDGWFDLCVASSSNKMRILRLLIYFLKGTQASQPEIFSTRARKIIVSALEGTLPAHCDGETLCHAGLELQIEIIPLALEFITKEEGRVCGKRRDFR